MPRTLLSLAPLLAAPLLASCLTPDAPADPTAVPPASKELTAYEGRPEIKGEVRRGLFKMNGAVQEHDYVVKGDLAFLDGDIAVDVGGGKPSDGIQQALAVTDLSDTWPNGTVPYAFASDVDDAYRTVIRDALAVWESKTPLKFVERTSQADYIEFSGADTGCYSNVGRQGGKQIINLEGINDEKDAPCGWQGTVLHEVGHAIGLFHEQSRPDRNTYLNVMTANMDSDKTHNVAIHTEGQMVGGYNFASIMQYSSFAFSKADNPTLERKGTWSVRYGGAGNWQTLRIGGTSEVSTRSLLIADLDGNGRDDAIKYDATGIYWLPNMTGAWQLRNSQVVPAGELAVGDWNADGKDDLLTVSSGWIRVSYNGTSSFYPAAPTTVPTSWMRFCDFNGDGRVDAFRADNNQWQVQYNPQQTWTSLGARPQQLLNLRFADVDHDGSCDVYGNANANDPDYLMYAASARDPFAAMPYDHATYAVIEPFFYVNKTIQGDFDGDGKIEVLGKRLNDDEDNPAYTYMLSVNAAGATYTSLANGGTPDPNYLTVADVNGDGRDDLLMTGFISGGGSLASTDIDTVKKMYSTQWQVSYGGSTVWNLLNLSGYSMDKAAIGDFDGNGKSDVFVIDGSKWLISYNGTGTFQHVNTSGYPMSRLKFADFNGDGKTDVFLIADSKFLVSYSATTPYQQLNASQMTNVQIGDLNGDKKADVFTAWGGHWYASWGGTTGWTELNTSNVTPDQIRLYDFNGDGRDDVFHATGTQWNVSYSGTSGWSTINTSTYDYDDIRFGDFDGNGKTDVFRADGTNWLVSWNGTGTWVTRNSSTYTNLGFGDFNGDGATDVIAMLGRIVD